MLTISNEGNVRIDKLVNDVVEGGRRRLTISQEEDATSLGLTSPNSAYARRVGLRGNQEDTFRRLVMNRDYDPLTVEWLHRWISSIDGVKAVVRLKSNSEQIEKYPHDGHLAHFEALSLLAILVSGETYAIDKHFGNFTPTHRIHRAFRQMANEVSQHQRKKIAVQLTRLALRKEDHSLWSDANLVKCCFALFYAAYLSAKYEYEDTSRAIYRAISSNERPTKEKFSGFMGFVAGGDLAATEEWLDISSDENGLRDETRRHSIRYYNGVGEAIRAVVLGLANPSVASLLPCHLDMATLHLKADPHTTLRSLTYHLLSPNSTLPKVRDNIEMARQQYPTLLNKTWTPFLTTLRQESADVARTLN